MLPFATVDERIAGKSFCKGGQKDDGSNPKRALHCDDVG